ncbi:MAG: pyridoxine 5'-phosphate synthase [Proteobacteria bacterium]|uniref:Pyridoxine 5'-phosphate synthase n=1 Tax=Candidatus Avisuccinivibrio stercorigallinarum TaxID=2840704 RepID=A0A9D9DA54_9GAMM|nr:pyridoxine 5'-phosphate synthase [Candidatus Avisuccinivibrio stercorigallinarum]
MGEIYLGVNIDHVATVRNARGGTYPDPVTAAAVAELAGADSITTHLREDRRHITDRDVRIIRETVQTKLNLEMAVNDDILAIAAALRPQAACFVPERRQEITTEGGLNVAGDSLRIGKAIEKLAALGTNCSMFIDPVKEQVDASKAVGAPTIEFHTGAYANAQGAEQLEELKRLQEMAAYAHSIGLHVNSGHGLNYQNVQAIAAIPEMEELNIGHSIIARAIFTGLSEAVREMKRLMREARAMRNTN